MGVLDKVRDFFYDDEEDIEEIPKKKKNEEKWNPKVFMTGFRLILLS